MTTSTLTHLDGSLSGAIYDADRLWGLDPADGVVERDAALIQIEKPF